MDPSEVACPVLDLFILFDSSESISASNFMDMKAFASGVVDSVFVNSDVAVGLGEYSTTFTLVTESFLTSPLETGSVIETITATDGTTRTATAMRESVRFLAQNRRTVGGVQAQSVLLVLTDRPTSRFDTANIEPLLSELAAESVTSIMVGIGRGVDVQELVTLALGSSQRVITSLSFGDLTGFTMDTVLQIGFTCVTGTVCETTSATVPNRRRRREAPTNNGMCSEENQIQFFGTCVLLLITNFSNISIRCL